MIQYSLQAISRAPASMDYTFYDGDGRQILTNDDADIADYFDLFYRELPIIPYTLSLIDADGNERFTLRKKTARPQSFPAFSLAFDGETVDFIEDRMRFSLPNICFCLGEEKFEVTGSVRSRIFRVESGGERIVAIEGEPVEGGKKYAIEILRDRLPLEVSLATTLVLDIYFHNY
ncbi:MAG: hypothetical protein SPI65_05980 [Peptoniphilus sp.]|nr:hypothetical protein [Peptoniphilus sp.]MDY6045106.1 hypothetical protein [Peptoniphilus sp.]